MFTHQQHIVSQLLVIDGSATPDYSKSKSRLNADAGTQRGQRGAESFNGPRNDEHYNGSGNHPAKLTEHPKEAKVASPWQ